MRTSPEKNGATAEALDRFTRLQTLTAALSQAVTSGQVADAIIAQGMAVLGANAGCVTALSEDGRELFLVRLTGPVAGVAERWRRFPVEAPVPLAEAVRERQAVILETFAERLPRYPALAEVVSSGDNGAMVALPMVVRGEALGSLGWGWPQDRTFTAEDRAFLATLAELCAQALDRARLYDAERVARERAEQAEAALRESEGRLRTLSNNLPHGAIYQGLADLRGGRRVTYVSAGVERIFGLTPAEVLADPYAMYRLIHEDDQDRVRAAEEEALRRLVPFDCEFRSYTGSGEVRWVQVRSAPRRLPTGEVIWDGLVLDVTDRKRAEEALGRERELLQAIIDQIPVMITLYEPDTKVVRLNPAFERTVGWSTRDAAGLSLMEHCYPDPAYRERVREFMQSCRGGWLDIRMRTRDGRDIETSWANVCLSDRTQVGIGLDITDRKRAEEALKEADRRKDEFLATLAHELRNPLAPIRTAVQVLRLKGLADPALRAASEIIDRQVRQMVRLVDDLLDVSRITRGKLQLRKEPVELAGVVRSAVETARPLIEAGGHELTVTLPPGPVVLDADPVRLAQVVANLLANAAKYTDKGGRIRLTAERDGGELVIAVKDTGIGIPAEHLPRLFEMFSQVTSALDRSQGGLGIGLSLVKGLVEMHGGTVRAHSDGPGKGSEFVVRLPVPEGPPGEKPSQPGDGEAALAPHYRILVVDDNRDAANSLGMLLRLMGHETTAVHDGLEAVAAAERWRPDVVLLDIGLPGLNGYEVARRLREQPWGRTVTLVAVTGWGQEEDKRRATEAGFDHHLTKPVAPADLEKLLAGFPRNG